MTGPLRAALKYAEEGFRVLALVPGGKTPRFEGVGVSRATTDPAQIEAWWTEAPAANIGIALGDYPDHRHLVAVDLDEGGDKSLLTLLRHGDRIPLTRMTRTGRGWHQLYWSPVPIPNSRNRLGPGIEVRCSGMYVVAPPSIHPDGSTYTAEGTSEIAEIPDWLLNPITSATTTRALATAVLLPGGEPDIEDMRAWGGYQPFAEQLLARVGRRIDQRFRPNWRESSGNSAEITRDSRGLYICFDNGHGAHPSSMILPEWYAALTTGTARVMRCPERVRWTARAQAELGYRDLPSVDHPPLPDDLTKDDRKVFGVFLHLRQLQADEYPVALSCRMPGRWTGDKTLTGRKGGKSIGRLQARGLIHLYGDSPSGYPNPTRTYVMGNGDPDPTLQERAQRPQDTSP